MRAAAIPLEDYFTPSLKMPLLSAIGLHLALFIANPIVMDHKNDLPKVPEMIVKYEEKMPATLTPPKPEPVVEKKKPMEKKKAKKGLAPKAVPKPAPAAKKTPPKPVRRPFVSRVEMPTFVPNAKDELMAASPVPGMAPAAKTRMVQQAVAPPLLTAKSRGIVAGDVRFKLQDKSALAGLDSRRVVVPLAEERGDIAVLPATPTLIDTKKGIGKGGYRFKPGEGSGAGELVGRNRTGVHGVIKTERYQEGAISGSGGAGKTIEGNGFQITGTVGDRKILHRQLPEYPAWAEEKGITAVVEIYFTVRADGTIRPNLRVQRSSGYAELDQLAKEALLKWKFSPAGGQDNDLSWGIITFRFTLQ